jgi:hypothetical protein
VAKRLLAPSWTTTLQVMALAVSRGPPGSGRLLRPGAADDDFKKDEVGKSCARSSPGYVTTGTVRITEIHSGKPAREVAVR